MIEDEQGLTMILSIFIIVTLLSLVYAFNIMIQTDNDNLIFSTQTSKAFWGAEAGVETALVYLNKVSPNLNKENSIQGQIGDANYNVTITKDHIFKYEVKSQGQYQGVTKTIVATLESIDNNGDGQAEGLVIATWREY